MAVSESKAFTPELDNLLRGVPKEYRQRFLNTVADRYMEVVSTTHFGHGSTFTDRDYQILQQVRGIKFARASALRVLPRQLQQGIGPVITVDASPYELAVLAYKVGELNMLQRMALVDHL